MPRRVPISGQGVTQKLLAELLNVDARQIRNLDRAGLPSFRRKENNEKRYPWPESLHWYIRFKQEEITKRLGTNARAEEAKADKLEAEAELAHMDLLERRGELASIEYLDQRVDAILSAVRGTMLSFGGKWAPALIGIPSEVEMRERLEPLIADGLAHIEQAVVKAAESLDEEELVEEADDNESEPDEPNVA